MSSEVDGGEDSGGDDDNSIGDGYYYCGEIFGCKVYFDGCNTCTCTNNGKSSGACTLMNCQKSINPAECKECGYGVLRNGQCLDD